MSDTPNQNFKIVAAITGYTLRKSADGTDKYVLSGMASNANIDLTGERMADTALAAMAKSLEANAVTINNEHGSSWDDDFGEVTKLWVTDSHELMMEAELDPDHYRTKTLIKALDKGKKLGLSIGGVVKEAAMEFFEDLGRKVMTYKDIALFHVAITGTPAVADTWVTPITKSVKDWKETPMPNEDTKVAKTDEQVEEVVEQTPVATPETPVDEPEVPAPAEGDEPEDIDQDTTEKSEAAEQSNAEVTPDPETPPATPEAPDQKDEAPASDESSPAPAEGDTSEEEETTKSLNAAKYEVEQLTKSLTEKDDKIEELTKSLTDKTTELETVQKSLAEKETELEKRNARKGLVFDKFGGQEVVKTDEQEITQAAHKQFASFITGGVR
jgi:phage head maturation protease